MSTESQGTLDNERPRRNTRRLPAPGAWWSRWSRPAEWPEPELLEQIVAAGDAAVEPLREVLRTRPRGWPAEASVCNAAGLLSVLQPASALPDLCAAARFYKNETTDSMGEALAAYGPPGLDALIELIRDPAVSGWQRGALIDCGLRARNRPRAQGPGGRSRTRGLHSGRRRGPAGGGLRGGASGEPVLGAHPSRSGTKRNSRGSRRRTRSSPSRRRPRAAARSDRDDEETICRGGRRSSELAPRRRASAPWTLPAWPTPRGGH